MKLKTITYDEAAEICPGNNSIMTFQLGYNQAVKVHNEKKKRDKSFRLDRINARLTEVENIVESMRQGLSDHAKAFENVYHLMAQVENKITNLADRMAAIGSEVDRMKQSISDLENATDANLTALRQLGTVIEEHSKDIQKMKG